MGAYPIGIVGESFENEDGSSRQAEIERCSAGEPVTLERDPGNRYDANCVKAISARGVQIGNISRDDDWICERMDRGGFVDARILSIGEGKRGHGVVLCVRTTEEDEWLSDKRRPDVEQSTTGCSIVFALIAVPALLVLAGCDDRPKHWNAYVYPDFEGSERYETIAGFKSL